jgi:hypothetical protein
MRAAAQIRPAQPRHSESYAPLTKLSPRKQIRIALLPLILFHPSQNEKAGENSGLVIARYSRLEDSNHKCSQECKNEAYGQKVHFPHHGASFCSRDA